jgi:hypothetical protein
VLDRIKTLAGQSAVYGLGGVVSRVLAVLLLPLYTRYLTRDDLGAVGVVVALSAVLVIVLNALGLFADPRFALPVAPAFVFFGSCALLGDRSTGARATPPSRTH